MKNKLSTLFLATVLTFSTGLLSGCAALGAVSAVGSVLATPKPVDAQTNSLIDEKAYGGLIAGEVVLNRLAINAVDMGLLIPGSPKAIQVADLLQGLSKITTAAKKAKDLNDAVSVNAKIKEGKDLYRQILALVS